MPIIAVIVLITVAGAFLCSLTEAALYSASRHRIETLRRRKNSGGERLAILRDKVDEPIAAILIFNTAIMTLGAIWLGALAAQRYGDRWMGVWSGLFTLLILFIGEIIPKSMGVRFADSLGPALAWPLQLVVWTIWPLVSLVSGLMRLFGRHADPAHPTEQDIISMTLLSQTGGQILKQEAHWIKNILRLNDIKTAEIMTPRARVKAVSESLKLSEVKPDREHWRYSRVLVHKDGDQDDILGVVLRRTVFAALLRRGKETPMRELMAPVHSIHDERPAHDLVGFFVKNKTQLAVVRGEGGRWTGLVTMEDVLEDMIGAEID